MRGIFQNTPERLLYFLRPQAGLLAAGDLETLPLAPSEAVLLHQHMLAARAHRILQADPRRFPLSPELEASLYRGFLTSVRAHALFADISQALFREFRSAAIPVIAIKGQLLAERIYEDPLDRTFSDLDLVFPKASRADVGRILAGMGYFPIADLPKFAANAHKIEYQNPESPGAIIECHFDLGYGPYRLGNFWREIRAYKDAFILSPVDEYLFLLYHGCVQHRLQKLIWLLDLVLMREKIPLDADLLARKAEAANLLPALEIAEYWIQNILGANSKARPALDRWLRKIALASPDGSDWEKIRLRALFSGSYWGTAKYALARNFARVISPEPKP